MTYKTSFLTILCAFILTVVPTHRADALSVINYSCSPFEYNFGYGMRDGTGDNIIRLQQILISQGYLSYSSATGYFGPLTFAAVRRFQVSNGISATGYVGPLTRGVLSGSGCSVPPHPPIVVPPVNQYQQPVISGIEGPTSLSTNQQGTWTIRASDPSNGYLSYSVLWGDESQAYNGNAYAANSNSFTQLASFSHTYYNPGTYTITFTVRNSYGYQTESRISVYVSGNGSGSYGTPTITYLSPSSGQFGTTVTVNGTNFTRYDNAVNFAGVSRAYVGIPSYDGRTLQFVPTVTPCSSGNYCAQIALISGDYQVSVTNQYGTSNSVTYRVGSSGTTDQTQTLSLNQTGYFDTLRLTPTVISEDSRCPSDVTCIQAGKVVVLATVATNSGSRSLSLSSNGETYTVDDGYRIQIVSVSPARYSNQGIPGDQYRITFRVWR